MDVISVAATVFFGYSLGLRDEVLFALLAVITIVMVNAVLMALSGYKLEPAGRLGLGESDD